MVERYNKANGTRYQIIIDNFKGICWLVDEHNNKLSDDELKNIYEYYMD